MGTTKRERQKDARQRRLEAERAASKRASRRQRVIAVVLVSLLLFTVLVLIAGRGDDGDGTATPTSTTSSDLAEGGPPRADPVPAGETITGETPCPEEDGSSPRASSFEQAPPMCIDPAKDYRAVFSTSEGEITVDLLEDEAPGTVNNFVVLARYHYYDGSSIHRTDPSIDIIQGGSPSTQSASDPGPGYTIEDEGDPAQRSYSEGDLVMARSAGEDSGGAQYFFVTGPNASALDAQGTYVTFGKITEGLDVVKSIIGMHEDDPSSGLGGAPAEVVLVESVTIEEA